MSRNARVALGFAYFFLTMTGYYILKPVRESFFLGEQGFSNLPKAHLLVMTSTYLTLLIYTFLIRRMGAGLLRLANLFFLICIAGFWVALSQFGSPEVRSGFAWVYYCWVSVFAVFAVTLFWSVVHTIFSPDEGSRCYGIIGSGGTLGALSGGWLTKQFAVQIGTENLLLMAVGVLAPCLILGEALIRQSAAGANQLILGGGDDAKKANRSLREIFANSPFLCALAAIVMLTIVISVFDEYRYGEIIQAGFEGESDQRTAFFGKAYFYSNCIGLFLSLIVTGYVQSRFGPRPGMTLYVAVILLSSIAFLSNSGLTLVLWSSVAVQSVAYSIYQWSRELLYTATTAEEKLVAKGFIDTFMFRAGAGTAALVLLAAAKWNWIPNPSRQISFIVIPLVLLLAGLAWWISREFNLKMRGNAADAFDA